MKKIITGNINEEWFELDKDEKYLIRPFPTSQGIFFPETPEEIGATGLKKFIYCVVNWVGLENEDGTPFECNDENKTFIYNYNDEITNFILIKIHSFNVALKGEIKN